MSPTRVNRFCRSCLSPGVTYATIRSRPLSGLFVAFVAAAAIAPTTAAAQTALTLEEAMNRARGNTAEARSLASTIEEAEARVQQARSGFWPHVDLTETVQRGNQPVYVFSSLLSQRRFSETNFAIPALNHPDPLTNTRTGIAVEQRIFDAGSTLLAV